MKTSLPSLKLVYTMMKSSILPGLSKGRKTKTSWAEGIITIAIEHCWNKGDLELLQLWWKNSIELILSFDVDQCISIHETSSAVQKLFFLVWGG